MDAPKSRTNLDEIFDGRQTPHRNERKTENQTL